MRGLSVGISLLGAVGVLMPSAGAAAGPCLIKSNFESICLDATGALSREAAGGYLYVGIGAQADRIATGYDWACGACHTSLKPEPGTYVDGTHLTVFRRRREAIGGGRRISWGGGWTLLNRGGQLCVARGRGPALACFPEGAFAFRDTARRSYMIHAPGPIQRLE
jgi:hypothetical protein